MPQSKADKIFFEFTGGINTEVSPLAFPDGISLDEENFELLPDGTRRRRRGLRLETGGQSISTSQFDLPENSAFAFHRWTNVANNPDIELVVVQLGTTIHIFDDTTTLSSGLYSEIIELDDFATTDSITDISDHPVTFADGLGFLFISGPHIEPLVVTWNSTDLTFSITPISTKIRDFKGIDDGTPVTTQPVGLSDDHYYNLRNRGWIDARIADYKTSTGEYPAKNQIPWMGYRRLKAVGYYEEDGNKEWNSTKLEAEVFGSASAPQGSLFLNPYEAVGAAVDGIVGTNTISTWSYVTSGNDWIITVTTAAVHGLVATDKVTISGNKWIYKTFYNVQVPRSFDGERTVVSAPTTTTFTFTITKPALFVTWKNQFAQLGFISDDTVPRVATVLDSRPKAVAWFSSRVVWAGVSASEYTDTIFFSQITTRETEFGRCYQANDPTAEHLNALLPTDGGTIQIPGMGGVVKMLPFGASLLIFSKIGVWELGPGQEGFFSATGYSVRKITDIEVLSPNNVVQGDFGIVFTSPRGIYALTQDSNSGFIVPQSLSDGRIQSLWNAIPKARQEQVQCLFDTNQKRYYILYCSHAEADPLNRLDKALVLDMNRGAFYKFAFPESTTQYITGALTTNAADETNTNKKLKFFVYKNSRANVEVCDLDHTDFVDYDGTELIPYLLTGYDNVGDFQRRRQAPVCHVFMKKTETGYTQVEDDLVPINESSIYLQSRWDWADRETSGKFGMPQQVYRHIRAYQPTGPTDTFDDGVPVVTTRNRLRGRGKALHLKFYGETGKDAHLIGWALQYAGSRSV